MAKKIFLEENKGIGSFLIGKSLEVINRLNLGKRLFEESNGDISVPTGRLAIKVLSNILDPILHGLEEAEPTIEEK